MARQKVRPHKVLSPKEEEDIVFGKVRAEGWMKGKVPSKRGGSSRLKIKKNKSGGKIMQGYKAGGKV
jgi:hypothetical protein